MLIFGRECFLNEIIWAYDYGGRPKNRWPAKHDNILMYVKDPDNYTFNRGRHRPHPLHGAGAGGQGKSRAGQAAHRYLVAHDRQPDRQGEDRLSDPEAAGYPAADRSQASSNPGDLVLDFFAGSGTTGAAALELGRNFLLVDNNPEAIEVMKKRFAGQPVEFETFTEGA